MGVPVSRSVVSVLFVCAAFATSAHADGPSNVYRNSYGTGSPGDIAAPVLNPAQEGQVVLGPLYDVRSVDGDAVHTNVQILNRNTADDTLPECTFADFVAGVDGVRCYNPDGGILARVRFRESLDSSAGLSFALALGCGETWAAALTLGANDLPQIRSSAPVVTDENPVEFVTSDAFASPVSFSMEEPGDPLDWQRGFFEVIGIEALPCRPRDGELSPQGDAWDKLPFGKRSEATNALAAKVFLVRSAAGQSFSYESPALSRFVTLRGGPIPLGGSVLDQLDQPTLEDCITYEPDGTTLLSKFECISAVNLAISSAEGYGQFDIEDLTAGQTRVAVALPTKSYRCGDPLEPRRAPFTCDPAGEEITCTVYDRLGNFSVDPLQPPPVNGQLPPPEPRCLLPRDVSVFALRADYADPAADFSLWTWELPEPETGKFALDLARNVDQALIHREVYPEQTPVLNVFSSSVEGYWGLPALGVVVQEFANGNVGGAYGNSTPLGSFQTVVHCEERL